VTFNRLVRTVLVASLALTGVTVSATASTADPAQPVDFIAVDDHVSPTSLGIYWWAGTVLPASGGYYNISNLTVGINEDDIGLRYQATAMPGGHSCTSMSSLAYCEIVGLDSEASYSISVTPVGTAFPTRQASQKYSPHESNPKCANINGPNLAGGDWSYCAITNNKVGRPYWSGNLANTRFDHALILGGDVDWFYRNFSGDSFAGSTILGADMRGGLQGLDFSNSYLHTVVFGSSDGFHGSVAGANFSGATLRNIDFRWTDISGANFNGVSYDETVIWPSGFTPPSSRTRVPSPTGTIIQANPQFLSVSWDAVTSSDVSASITYTASTDSGESCTTTGTSCDIAGLTNGRSYSVTVTATDGTYTSLPSLAVTGMPVGPPTAPSILSVLAVSAQATLTIGAPSDLGDVALSGYDFSIDNGTSWSHFASASGPFVIGGLTNGTTYQVKVRAVNSVGAGEASAALAVSPTKLIPNRPVIASVAAGNSSATVTITKPTDLTSQSITGYQYSINKGASYQNASVTNGSFTITGLINGVATSVQIRATNFNGNSLPSVSKPVTPATTPSAPTVGTIAPSAVALSIAFTAPNNGGSAITSYQYSLDGGTNWITPKVVVKASPLKVTGLANATTYHVQVRAVNAMGTGTASTTVDATTPVLVPGAPVISSITKARTSLIVDVNAPINTGGGAILNYAYSTDGKTWVPVSPASTSTHVVITGLKNNTTYPIRIAAINSAGQGAIASSAARTLQ
jgi:uncharacterized protein YjbI with pentapeptide repeats